LGRHTEAKKCLRKAKELELNEQKLKVSELVNIPQSSFETQTRTQLHEKTFKGGTSEGKEGWKPSETWDTMSHITKKGFKIYLQMLKNAALLGWKAGITVVKWEIRIIKGFLKGLFKYIGGGGDESE